MEYHQNRVIAIEVEGADDLIISEAHDGVQCFTDAQFNYLRYWNEGKGKLEALFLGGAILKQLIEHGIPATIREQPTSEEVDWLVEAQMQKIETELDELNEG